MTWRQAAEVCNKLGGHLLHIKDQLDSSSKNKLINFVVKEYVIYNLFQSENIDITYLGLKLDDKVS